MSQYHRLVDKHPIPTQWFKEVVIFLVGYLYPTTHTDVCSSGGIVTKQFIDLLVTLPETNSSHLKSRDWKLLGCQHFSTSPLIFCSPFFFGGGLLLCPFLPQSGSQTVINRIVAPYK